MNKKELLEKLKELSNSQIDGMDDTEEVHLIADGLLIEFINDPEIKVAYNKINKWYA